MSARWSELLPNQSERSTSVEAKAVKVAELADKDEQTSSAVDGHADVI